VDAVADRESEGCAVGRGDISGWLVTEVAELDVSSGNFLAGVAVELQFAKVGERLNGQRCERIVVSVGVV